MLEIVIAHNNKLEVTLILQALTDTHVAAVASCSVTRKIRISVEGDLSPEVLDKIFATPGVTNVTQRRV